MITLVMNIPPIIVTAVLGLAWIGLAARRWRWSLLIDLACIVLYARLPSLATCLWVPVQFAIRNVPELAREVALILKAGECHGWTARAILVLLPGLDHYAAPSTQAPPPTQTPAPAIGATVVLDPAALPDLLMNEWLAALNRDQTAPHLGVVGPTRLGKTTLVLVLLYYRLGSFVIVTPKARSTDPWGGFPAIRIKMDTASSAVDWTPIVTAIEAVHYEMIRRNAEDTAHQEEPIHLVIDELTTVLAENPQLIRKVIDLWTIGASAKVFVIAIATDVNVRGWKIEGRRDVVDNLVFAKVEPGRYWSMGRIDPNGRLIEARRMDTKQLLGIAERVDLHHRLWPGLSVSSVMVGGRSAPAPGQGPAQAPDAGRLPTAPDRLLDDLIRAGYTRAQGEAELHSRGYGLDTNRWRDRRAVLGVGRARGTRRPAAKRSTMSRN